MADEEMRAALDRHWKASDDGDFDAEHSIYREDAVLEYPQSGEQIQGRRNIQLTRSLQPNKKRFDVHRILGAGELWVTQYILSYDGKPSYTVSIMEFQGEKVARETQYFADPFAAPAWRKGKISPAAPGAIRSGVVEYNVQTLVAASIAASCAGISAALGCPAWAMFLGWVAALITDHSFKEIFYSYACLLVGIAIGAAGSVFVGDLRPSMGPFADAIVILGMASIIASMRKMPRIHYVPSYILGVIGMFAIHADTLGIGVIKVFFPSVLGASGVWFATRMQMRIAKKSTGSNRRSE